MGFAGQVFAARVAVGLALPTPSQLESSGGMIAGFANKLYGRLRASQQANAEVSLQNSKNQLKKAQENLSRIQQQNKARISAVAQDSIKAISSAYSKTPRLETTEGFKSFIDAAKSAPGQLAGKMEPLFANINEDLSGAEQYAQMMEGFMQATDGADDALIEWLGHRVESLKLAKQEASLEPGGLAIDEEIEFNDLIKDAENYLDTMKEHAAFKKGNLVPAIKAVEKAEKDVMKASDHANDVKEETIKLQHQLGVAINKTVFTIQTGFITSLKESIAQLTAFYYKLNQNTQELIAFERELKNANSVFALTNSELFNVGDTVTQFGQEFGLAMQNGAEGLYQLASAGVTAEEALAILPETLKLSMAVQGDHNTISKLTAQTLFGFEMSMEQAGEVTDMFAHAIQKSLIEYEDLASAVKFALPFFTSTGQTIEQLLGSLQVLTNRALEAGIAGRGLRQGVAELAESLGDASANFKQMGVEVVDSQGNMLQLTEIAANFHAVLEEGVINDTELLTTLIQDLNVRGATAFVHLVQASDEFTEAVSDLENAGGELDEMVRIQNESLMAQIQILSNNVQAIFFLRDATYEGTEYMNAFHEEVVRGIESLQELLVTTQNGVYVLTEFGQGLQDIAVEGVRAMVDLLEDAVRITKDFTKEGLGSVEMIRILMVPLQSLLKVVNFLGPEFIKLYMTFRLVNMVLPIYTLLMAASTVATMMYAGAKGAETLVKENNVRVTIKEAFWLEVTQKLTWENIGAILMYIPLQIKKAVLGARAAAVEQGQWMWKKLYNAEEKKGILYKLWNIKATFASIAVKIKEYVIDQARTVGMVKGMKWRSANLAVEWRTIFATMWKNKLKTVEMLLEATGVKWLARKIGLVFIWNKLAAFSNFLLGRNLAMKRREIIMSKLTWIWKKLINKAMWQQIGLTALGAVGWSLFWIAATGGIIILVAFFVVLAIKLNEQFDLLTQFKIFFQHIINMVAWYVQVWIDAGVALADWAMNGTSVFMKFGLFVKHIFLMIAYYIDIAAEKVVGFIDSAKGAWEFWTNANGGYNVPFIPFIATGKANVYGRQYGGSAYSEGGGAYMVGEQGPELFMPRDSGQVIPNKDLNTARTNKLYNQSMGSTQMGTQQASVIYVDRIESNNTNSKNTKIGVDVFA